VFLEKECGGTNRGKKEILWENLRGKEVPKKGSALKRKRWGRETLIGKKGQGEGGGIPEKNIGKKNNTKAKVITRSLIVRKVSRMWVRKDQRGIMGEK